MQTINGGSRMYQLDLGVGTVNAGWGGVYTEYYCACRKESINPEFFTGGGYSLNLQLDAIGKLGFGFSFTNENTKGFKVYGFSIGLGVDAIPNGIDININRTWSSQTFQGLKNIFK